MIGRSKRARWLFTGFFSIVALAACASQSYKVDYYENGQFVNQVSGDKKSLFGYLLMRLRTTQAEWPSKVELQETIQSPPIRSEQLRIQFINHSSFLIQVDGINILTDPVFENRVSPVSWAGPKRVIQPGLELSSLPSIDIILISHDHYDHLEVSSIEYLVKRDKAMVYLGLGAGRVLSKGSFQELEWWQKVERKGLEIEFTPAQHFSGRGLFDRNSTLWGSFIIRSPNRLIYFGGDTGYGPHFKQIGEKYPGIDVAILPVGAYAPRSFMSYQHMDPEESVRAFNDLKARFGLGMHWGTFQLTNEPREEPRQRIENLKLSNFYVPENGDCYQHSEMTLLACRSEVNN